MSLPLCLALSLLSFYLSLSLSLPPCSSPTTFFPPYLPPGSLTSSSFHLYLPLPLPPASSPSHYSTCFSLVLYVAANFCPLAFFASFPSTPLSISPSYLASPQQQQMRFPFYRASLLCLSPYFPPSLFGSPFSCSIHSSLLPLRALFCLNQELKCCILTQTMPAIQSGPV